VGWRVFRKPGNVTEDGVPAALHQRICHHTSPLSLTCHLGRDSGRLPPTNLLYRRSTSPSSANGIFQFPASPYKATAKILNISKLTENHLITKKTHNVYPIRQAMHSHRHCLMTFNLIQLLFLADRNNRVLKCDVTETAPLFSEIDFHFCNDSCDEVGSRCYCNIDTTLHTCSCPPGYHLTTDLNATDICQRQ